MARYIHQLKKWPDFTWNNEVLMPLLSGIRYKQGRLQGQMQLLGFTLRDETSLQVLTLDVLKSSEIEGEVLSSDEVRSSIARRLGMDIGGMVSSDRSVEGVVDMMLDATQQYAALLDKERLCNWHAALFPTGRSGMYNITVADWRADHDGPMQVISGPMGKERVHYEAPASDRLEQEMHMFLEWFNKINTVDPVLKSGIAHLWFVTIHPFDDGNGRMGRAIADMQLARADGNTQRFYSMSAQIRLARNAYYAVLEKTQQGDLDITEWLLWFLNCMDAALDATENLLQGVLQKAAFWDMHHNTTINERQRTMINKLFDGFTGKLTSSKWAILTKCSPDTALRDIQDLLQKDMLEKETAGGRSTSYVLRIK